MPAAPRRRRASLALTVLRLALSGLLICAPVLLPALVINVMPSPDVEGAGAVIALAALAGLWLTAQFGVPLARTSMHPRAEQRASEQSLN